MHQLGSLSKKKYFMYLSFHFIYYTTRTQLTYHIWMADQTIFDKLIKKQIPSKVVFQDDFVFAFRDIAPAAPTHILIIPKHKDGLTGISKAEDKHEVILGKLLVAASHIAKQEKLGQGYRLVINEGQHGGQVVPHIHVHLLGGKAFGWPPG